MKNNIINLSSHLKDSKYEYLSGVGFRKKRGSMTLREKLERKTKKRANAKIIPFPMKCL